MQGIYYRKTMFKVLKYSFYDLTRSRWVYSYSIFFLLLGFGLIWFSQDLSKSLVSLLNIVLILCPLVGAMFGALYYYNSKEFIYLLLALPLDRKSIFAGKYLGLSLSLSLSFVVGTGIPFLVFQVFLTSQFLNFILLLLIGVVLTFIFTGIAFVITLYHENPIKGFGLVLFVWLLMVVIYDGIFLLSLVFFSQYPLDHYAMIMTLLNPVDLSRVFIMLQLDFSALMGYTGAVFKKYMGTAQGMIIAASFLILWVTVPVYLFLRIARKKDF